MKVMIIPIVIGALSTVTKGLVQGLADLEITVLVETIQTTALLRSARILRKVLETCCHSNFSGKPSANARGCEKLSSSKIMITRKQKWEGKMNHWELLKKLKFDHTYNKYMHYPESIQENEMHKIL